MKKKILILFLAAVAVAGVCGISSADDCGKCDCEQGMVCMRQQMRMEDKVSFIDKFHRKLFFILMNSKELGLTDAQMDKIHELKMTLKKDLVMKEAQIEVAALNIMDALETDNVDLNAVNTLIDQKYELKKNTAKSIAKACVDMRAILTAEQYKKIKDMWMEKMMSKMKGKMNCEEECPMMEKKEHKGMGMGMKR